MVGSRARRVSEAKALDHVAGYCVVNDISERTDTPVEIIERSLPGLTDRLLKNRMIIDEVH